MRACVRLRPLARPFQHIVTLSQGFSQETGTAGGDGHLNFQLRFKKRVRPTGSEILGS